MRTVCACNSHKNKLKLQKRGETTDLKQSSKKLLRCGACQPGAVLMATLPGGQKGYHHESPLALEAPSVCLEANSGWDAKFWRCNTVIAMLGFSRHGFQVGSTERSIWTQVWVSSWACMKSSLAFHPANHPTSMSMCLV